MANVKKKKFEGMDNIGKYKPKLYEGIEFKPLESIVNEEILIKEFKPDLKGEYGAYDAFLFNDGEHDFWTYSGSDAIRQSLRLAPTYPIVATVTQKSNKAGQKYFCFADA